MVTNGQGNISLFLYTSRSICLLGVRSLSLPIKSVKLDPGILLRFLDKAM